MAQWQWWTDVLTNALFLIASHLTRTRRVYQITAAALRLLQHQGHAKYTTKVADDEEVITIEEWTSQMSKKSPQFLYWVRVLDLELCCLFCVVTMVRSKLRLQLNEGIRPPKHILHQKMYIYLHHFFLFVALFLQQTKLTLKSVIFISEETHVLGRNVFRY